MDIRRMPKDRALALLSTFTLAVTLVMVPSRVKNAKFIQFKTVLNIHSKKAEPPRLAYLSLLSEAQSSKSEGSVENSKTLNEVVGNINGIRSSEITRVKRVNIEPLSVDRQEIEVQKKSREWIGQLSQNQKNRILDADRAHGTLDQDWSIPTFKEMAAEKIAEIQVQSLSQQKSPVTVYSQSPTGEKITPEILKTKGVVPREEASQGGVSVAGVIELKEGAAIGSDRFIEIRRFVDGIPKEVGRYEYNGTFAINIADMSGSIHAELFDQHNRVLASGSHRLGKDNTPKDLKNLRIQIKPKNYLASTQYDFNKLTDNLEAVRLQSNQSVKAVAYSATLDTELKTDELGTFQLSDISENSWNIIRTESVKHHPTINLISSGRDNRQPLLTNSFVSALLSVTREQANMSLYPETGSVVFGQVIVDGKPLEGAEVFVEGFDDYKPTYLLEGFIPKSQLVMTSKSGYFILADLPSGMHSIVAKRAGQLIGHANIIVDNDHVSIANIAGSSHQDSVEIKSYDAFNGEPIVTRASLQSLEQQLSVEGAIEVKLQSLRRLGLLYSEPLDQDYIAAQYIYSDDDEYIHLPAVKTSFLNEIAASAKVSLQPDMGTIIGFVPEDSFEVYLTHEKQYSTENIIYFDHSGHRSQNAVAGGGFVLFNVPVGVQSVVIVSKTTGLMVSKVIPVDLSSTTVLKLRF